jgi:hypothetical protein
MIYTELTKKAMRIAFDAHKDQVDKSGLPYIFHPFHLAEQMTDEVSVCAALLHDVAEDTPISFEDLAAQGIPEVVIETLKLLTHDSSVLYMDYVQAVKGSGNQTAIAVKLADLRHNSDTSRLDTVDDKVVARLKKYKAAMDILESCGKKKSVYIDREAGTGYTSYILRVDGVDYCTKGELVVPRSHSDPIQTHDRMTKKTFTTHRNPAYEHITIVPGLKLEYLVYDGVNPNPVAKMVRDFGPAFTSPSSDSYYIYDESYTDGECPFPTISFDTNGPLDSKFLERLPENDVCVSVYNDKTFVYDPCSLVDERFAVSVAEQHMKWLPHIFHAFILGLSA